MRARGCESTASADKRRRPVRERYSGSSGTTQLQHIVFTLISSSCAVLYSTLPRVNMADSPPALSHPPTHVLLIPAPSPSDPPPPYPSRDRRQRGGRSGRRRRTVIEPPDHLQIPSGGTDHSDHEGPPPSSPSPFSPHVDGIPEPTENTPLLTASPRLPPGGIGRRQRTLSLSSTAQSTHSVAPSFAQTVLSAFQPELDCDLDPDEPHQEDSDYRRTDSPTPRPVPESQSRMFATELGSPRLGGGRRSQPPGRWRRYFRPLTIRAYYSALLHLLVFNFPYALAAWIYLFVFTLVRLSNASREVEGRLIGTALIAF